MSENANVVDEVATEGDVLDVQKGDRVLWHPSGVRKAGEEHGALVTTVHGDGALGLHILTPRSPQFVLRQRVRHVDAPRGPKEDVGEDGRWDFAPQYLERQRLIAKAERVLEKAGQQLTEGNPQRRGLGPQLRRRKATASAATEKQEVADA